MRIHVRDVLNKLSSEVISEIGKELAPYVQSLIAEDALEELDVIEQLVYLLTNQDTLSILWTQLSTYEQAVLKYFIFHVGDDLLTYRQIEGELLGIKPTTFRLGLTGLRRKGFIYTIRRQWREVAYILPTDLAESLYRILLHIENREQIEPCVEMVYKEEQWEREPIYIDMFLLLVQLRAEKECAVPLTKRGSIHKRYVRAWQMLWPDREELLSTLPFSYECRDIYTHHMAIVLDFLTRKQLISWYEDRLVLNNSKAVEWMKHKREEIKRDFITYWTALYRPSTPWLRRYQQDMLMTEDTEWIYLLSFVEQWEDEYTLPNILELKQLIRTEVLEPLLVLGLIETGITETGEEVWRWKEDREESGNVWIQPSLEIYCPNTLSFSLLWELTKLLDIENWETMLVMNLSKSKVMQCIEQGEDLMEWVTNLEDKLACSFPTVFIEQLHMWARSGVQARLSKKLVLELEDEILAKAWLDWSELADIEVREIQQGVFLLDLDKEEEIKHLFAKRGVPLLQVSEKSEEVTQNVTRNFFISSSYDQDHQLKVESVFPELTEAIPIWNTLPEIWKKQLSPYHEQTKRAMIKQAVEHELRLKVETNVGELMEILPRLIQVEDGRWVCYDVQNNKYELEQFSRLQLLFPVQSHSC